MGNPCTAMKSSTHSRQLEKALLLSCSLLLLLSRFSHAKICTSMLESPSVSALFCGLSGNYIPESSLYQ